LISKLYIVQKSLPLMELLDPLLALCASLPEVNAKNSIIPDFTKVTAKNVVAFFS
jgi:hypothetical protein